MDAALDQLTNTLPTTLRHYPPLFKQLRHDKLWHQLTVALDAFAADPAAAAHLPFLFKHFISVAPLPALMSPYAYGRLAIKTARQLEAGKEAVELLCVLRHEYDGKVEPELKAVFLMTSVEYAHHAILLGQVEEAKRVMAECKLITEQLVGLKPSIVAAYHRVMAEVSKAEGRHDDLYRHLVAFLELLASDGCEEERVFADAAMAKDFMLSALLSPFVYNFGQLLSFDLLQNTSVDQQLLATIRVFQSGDINATLPTIDSPLLTKNNNTLTHKRKLMALVELLSVHAQHGHRRIPIASLADRLHLPDTAKAELLLLDALSMDLFTGTIDQCDMAVDLRDVTPLHLDHGQIERLRDGYLLYLARLDDRISRVLADLPATVQY